MKHLSLPIGPHGGVVLGMAVVGLLLVVAPWLTTWKSPPVALSALQAAVSTEVSHEIHRAKAYRARQDESQRRTGGTYNRLPYITRLDILRASGSTVSFRAEFEGQVPDELLTAIGDMSLKSFIDYGRQAMFYPKAIVQKNMEGRRTVGGEIENLSVLSNKTDPKTTGRRPAFYGSEIEQVIAVAFKQAVFPGWERAFEGDVFQDMTFTDGGIVVSRNSLPSYVRVAMPLAGLGFLFVAARLHARARWGGPDRSFRLNVSFGYVPRST